MRNVVVVSFLWALLCLSCTRSSEALRIHYNNSIPEAIEIQSSLIDVSYPDSIAIHLDVHIKGATQGLSILGNVTHEGEYYRFTPIVHLTRGQTYSVNWRAVDIGDVTVPIDSNAVQPSVAAMYPSGDTIPENTLKLYLEFSQPMSEGRALRFITVMKSGADTMSGTFLDLQPELWNDERTVLTLWIDPGRVKTGLIPNRELGLPLEQRHSYTINVSDQWKSAAGVSLDRPFSKTYYVTTRDNLRPSTHSWTAHEPTAGTSRELRVDLHDVLDKWQLERELAIRNSSNQVVPGNFKVEAAESVVIFIPNQNWRSGKYVITVPSTLEDMAGNSFGRLFDTDLRSIQPGSSDDTYTFEFIVR